MNKQITLIILAALISNSSYAANLKFYRKNLVDISALNKNNSQDDEMKKSISELRSKLTVSSNIEGLDFNNGPFSVAQASGRGNRLYTSFIMKDILRDTILKMNNQIKYGDASKFNPEYSRLDIKKQKYEYYQKLVVNSLRKKDGIINIPVPEGTPQKQEFRSGISQFLRSVKDWFITKIYTTQSDTEAIDDVTGEKWAKDSGREEKARLINEHLKKAPQTKDGKSIISYFGEVVAVSTVDGYVQRLRFKNLHNGDIPVPLTALLSYRMGKDSLFIATQQHIIDYLSRQSDFLGRRYYFLTNPSIIDKFSTLIDGEEKQTIQLIKDNPELQASGMSEFVKSKSAKENFKRLYNYFYENETSIGAANELEFLKRRLGEIEDVLPFLKSKQVDAIEVNQYFAKLSTEQMDYMIDMYLQLRGGDILSPEESVIFDRDFAEYQKIRVESVKEADVTKKEIAQQELRNALLADYQFYYTLNTEISAFNIWLDEAKRFKEGSDQDLNLIRSHRK